MEGQTINLVLHQHLVKMEKDSIYNNPLDKTKARNAYKVIADLMGELGENNEELVVLEKGQDATNLINDPRFKEGVNVTLYGAHLERGLQDAYKVLEKKGCEVTYHKSGCI